MMPVNYTEFEETLKLESPPVHWSEALKALWFDAKGDWEASHNIAQDMYSHLGSWIHAHLHRKEGDRFNAGYWYRQANKAYPEISLDTELRELVEFVLG
ncbi:hypothetical protein J8L85_10675 [Maribacter sp. MMG018]|uniref:hypothetical protein n=1 Tax=Maribacter sp. MMG018 TaxID=2822688 RepID=UPI001B35F55C|nr:hypothetical protein [Maribacter sp. MMG018]MBQ4914903.1 hypothetical protein [Maribacter sp. MMG018]